MKLVYIGRSFTSTVIIDLNNLQDQDSEDLELPPDPENNLIFDPRQIVAYYGHNGSTFDIKVQDATHLVVTRTDKNYGWDDHLYFRVYDRTKEDVPAAFDSSVPYDYCGLKHEYAPRDTVVAKVNPTIATIKQSAFDGCYFVRTILLPRDLKHIGSRAFSRCSSIDILVIPPTVTNIHHQAFAWCMHMRIIKLPDDIDLDNVADDTVRGCDLLESGFPYDRTFNQWLKDRYDPYPLHKVCYNAYVTVEEIQQCILDHPNAAYLTDEFDMTALHMITIMACTSNLQTASDKCIGQEQHEAGITSEGTRLIIACFNANMSAAFMQDNMDKSPLDYLLESLNSLDVHTGLMSSLCMHWSASVGSQAESAYHDEMAH